MGSRGQTGSQKETLNADRVVAGFKAQALPLHLALSDSSPRIEFRRRGFSPILPSTHIIWYRSLLCGKGFRIMASMTNSPAMAAVVGASVKNCAPLRNAVVNLNFGGRTKLGGLRMVADRVPGLNTGSRNYTVAALEGGNSTMLQSASGDAQYGGDEFDKVSYTTVTFK